MKQISGSGHNLSYKPFIKNISIEPASSNRQKSTDTNNKTFFSNIKAQLNNIRTDVNKLVTKDSVKPLNINKSYNVSTGNKIEGGNHMEASTDKNIEKKAYIQPSQKYVSTITALETKLAKTTNDLNQQISKSSEILNQLEEQRRHQMQLRNQINLWKQNCSKIQYQLINKTKEVQNFKIQLQKGQKQNGQLLNSIQQLQLELRKNPIKLERSSSQPDPHTIEKLKQQQILVINLQKDIQYLEEENRRLRENVQYSERNKEIQINSIMKNCEQKINRAEAKTYKELGSGFQVKINQLLDENYSLKNKIHLLESHREQDRVKIESLTSTVDAYEVRDKETGKGANEIQMENLRNKVMQLQQQIDKMESDHEYQIMKLQNMMDEMKESSKNKNGDNKSFNQILKDQINEIEGLKEKLKEKTEIINKLKR